MGFFFEKMGVVNWRCLMSCVIADLIRNLNVSGDSGSEAGMTAVAHQRNVVILETMRRLIFMMGAC